MCPRKINVDENDVHIRPARVIERKSIATKQAASSQAAPECVEFQYNNRKQKAQGQNNGGKAHRTDIDGNQNQCHYKKVGH